MRRVANLLTLLPPLASLVFLLAFGTAWAEPPYRPDTGEKVRRLTPGTLRVASPPGAAGSVYLYWNGTIAHPMAQQIGEAFDAFKGSRRRFVLHFDSGGGSVMEGERVIALLIKIRSSHQLDTVVGPGSRCGSMCLPLYLQGQNRFGARSSSWLFHEITRPGSAAFQQKRVEGSYARLIGRYWIPAGVSKAWIDEMLKLTDNHDWWQTGQDLITANAGIITRPIDNRRPRHLEVEAKPERAPLPVADPVSEPVPSAAESQPPPPAAPTVAQPSSLAEPAGRPADVSKPQPDWPGP